jgi:hypothetical protein
MEFTVAHAEALMKQDPVASQPFSRSPNTSAPMPAETGPFLKIKAAICSSVGARPVAKVKNCSVPLTTLLAS